MQERRLAAIMFTDIVGYTSLMGKDEMDTLNLLSRIQEIQKIQIKYYGGVLVKEIGDGLLAYFDHPEEAILCSIQIQKSLAERKEVNIRIGLHWAEIIVQEGDIYGDGVNIASRIEGLADPGGIYISEALKNALDQEDRIVSRNLGKAKLKNVRKPVIIYAIQGENLPIPSMKRFHRLANPRKKIATIPAVISFLLILLIAFSVVKYFDRRARVIEAEASLDHIEDLVNLNWRDYSEAYYLAKEAELIIPNNEKLKDLIEKASVSINVTTDPDGAMVYYKLYDKPEDAWQNLGLTPLDSVRVPISVFRWKIEKEGYETVLAASLTFGFKDLTNMKQYDMYTGSDMYRILDQEGTIPSDMVRVAGGVTPSGNLGDFFIDKFEVTNMKYKKFIDDGGYENPDYWPELIFQLGDSLEWEEAIRYFVDRTGQAGPSTWEYQNFPEGHADYPVNGINWFEANAFAHFEGKYIPTKDHWGLARGEGNTIVIPQLGGNAIFAPFNNFHGDGPVEVGAYNGLTSFGAYDMPGNVREWCWNESDLGRWMRGGAWNDNPYMFGYSSQADPYDRSERNGLRCVVYPDPGNIPESTFARAYFPVDKLTVELPVPITDEQFEVYRAYYDYDSTALNEVIISRSEYDRGWILEKVEFDAAYDNERMIAYIFLPVNAEPPYQTVIYGPGENVLYQESSDDIENFFEFTAFCEFFVRNGRALIFPVFKGSFERRGESSPFKVPVESHQLTANLTRIIKDYRRCLDYLETRKDFDLDKVCFYGVSLSPAFGAYLAAVDARISTNIFYAGGWSWLFKARPEINMAYFLSRVKISTLMINGRFDALHSLDNILNTYNLLGTAEKDKKLILHDSDHLAPVELLVSESLFWLDQKFGEVEYSIEIQPLDNPLVFSRYK